MTTRRDMLKYGLGGAGYGLLAPTVSMGQLIFPDGYRPSIVEAPSPPVTPYKDPLNVMPIAQPVDPATLRPVTEVRVTSGC